MWLRSDRSKLNRRSERGATLTGYALTMATMVVVALGAMSLLQDNSETFLVGTGDNIGDARISEADAAISTQATYTGGNSTGQGAYSGTPAAPIIAGPGPVGPANTFFTTAANVETGEFFTMNGANEFCTQSSGGLAIIQPCPTTGPAAAQFDRYVETIGGDTYTFMHDGFGGCISRAGNGDLSSLDEVEVIPCNNQDPFQRWTSTFQDPLNPSRCLDVDGGVAAGGQLATSPCPNESWDFGATPPAPPVGPVPFVAAPHTSTVSSTTSWNSGLPNTGPLALVTADAGTYEILLTGVNAPDSGANSFYVTVNGGPAIRWGIDFPTVNGTIQRATDLDGLTIVPLTVSAGAGETITVTVWDREDGTSMGGVQIVKL